MVSSNIILSPKSHNSITTAPSTAAVNTVLKISRWECSLTLPFQTLRAYLFTVSHISGHFIFRYYHIFSDSGLLIRALPSFGHYCTTTVPTRHHFSARACSVLLSFFLSFCRTHNNNNYYYECNNTSIFKIKKKKKKKRLPEKKNIHYTSIFVTQLSTVFNLLSITTAEKFLKHCWQYFYQHKQKEFSFQFELPPSLFSPPITIIL